MKKLHDHPFFKPRRPTATLTPKKPRFSSGTLLSLAAVVISITAASISFWQLDLMREHNRLSVRPYLMITPHLTAEKSGLYLSNEGLARASSLRSAFASAIKRSMGLGTAAGPLCWRKRD